MPTRSPSTSAARRYQSPVVVLAAAAGAGILAFASSLPVGGASPIGKNLPIDAQATSQTDLTANNSPTMVRNPANAANLVVVNRIDSPRYSCALHVSADGGASWSGSPVPAPVGAELPIRCYAPDVAFDRGGTMYLSFVTLEGAGNSPHALWLSSSNDGGRTLAEPVQVSGPLAFQVRLSADPDRVGRLYLSWVQADSVGTFLFATLANPVVVSRSDDGGATWGAPVRVNPPSRRRVVAPSTVVGPGGRLYLLYLDVGDDRLDYEGAHAGRGGPVFGGRWSLVLSRSDDGGGTWLETEVDASVVPTERFVVFLPPSPSLAVDRHNGHVYVAFADGRAGDADVWLWSSPGGTEPFGPPRRVNDTRLHDRTSQYRPRLAVAPDGRIDVVYYDRRADPADVLNRVSFQSSRDGGASFEKAIELSDRAFSSLVGYGSERDLPDLGSRLDLVSTDRRVLAVWTDTRAGTESTQKQDLARQVVDISGASPWRQPLRTGGWALVVLGSTAGLLQMMQVWKRRAGSRLRHPVSNLGGRSVERSDGAAPDGTAHR